MPGHVTYMDNYLNQQNLDYEQVLDIIWELKGIWDARHAKKGLAFAERKTLTFLRKWWTLLAPRKDDAAYKLKDSLTCFVAVDPEDMMYLPRNRAALSVGVAGGGAECPGAARWQQQQYQHRSRSVVAAGLGQR